MKKHLLLFIPLFLCLGFSFGQTNISGKVLNQEDEALQGASIALLQASDSVMKGFAFSAANGQFLVRRASPGEYLLQISFIGFKKYYKSLSIEKGDPPLDLGEIKMTPGDITLGEVEIEGERTPIIMKKDTIEYNAAAFKTQPNAVVEDLLKKLPGVEVDQDGGIKAQGEQVQQILVDGKEFFGQDPKIATKNLPADAVDKVQVFDKKSDMAEFSGIDDGVRNKTINLELKEDMKQGVFGKVEGGYGTEDRYAGKGNVNRFSNKLQFSAIGMANNTNEQGFSFDEYLNFIGGFQNLMGFDAGGGGGGVEINIDGGSLGLPIDQGMGNGFVNTGAGGVNFNYDFGKKTELRTSYFFNSVNNIQDRQTSRQNFLDDAVYDYQENNRQETQTLGHRANLNFKHKIDSTQQLLLRASFGANNGTITGRRENRTFSPDGSLQNDASQSNDAESQNMDANATLTYRKRFGKKGRILTTSGNFRYRDVDQSNLFQSLTQLFTAQDSIDSETSLFQNHLLVDEQLDFGLRLSFTEPLGKGKYLELNASHQNAGNELKKDVYDITSLANTRETFNTDLSNHYERSYISNQVGLRFKYNKKKSNLTLGLSALQSTLEGDLLLSNTQINKDFRVLLPSLNWSYEIATGQDLRFTYRTRLREPSIRQLQPIVDNSNPLNIFVGNPDLKAEYNHNASLNYHSFSQFSMIALFASVQGAYTQNKITNATTIDDRFRQFTSYLNVDRDIRLTGYGSISGPLRWMKSRVGFNSNVTYNRAIVFVNNTENNADRLWSSVEFTLENSNKDVVDILVGTSLDHTQTSYSVNQELNRNYVNQTVFGDLRVNFGDKWYIKTSMDLEIYGGQAFSERQNVPIWRAEMSRYLFKGNRGELKVSAFDLLNRNLGVDRRSELNFIEETRTQSLGRFFMFSFVYNLSKFGAEQPGGIKIVTGRRR